MPITITKGTSSSTFVYGPEHQRARQNRGDGMVVIYAGAQEVETKAGITTVKTYWPNGVGLEIDKTGQSSTQLMWTHADRLGSPVSITDSAGNLAEKLGYDAWGKRRTTDGVSTPDTLDGVVDNKGFTHHEMLDQLDLVHMNGRVYDPWTGRFLSGDPLVQDPINGQNYNRYSYVLNNPTNLTDPTGFCAEGSDGVGSRICGAVNPQAFGNGFNGYAAQAHDKLVTQYNQAVVTIKQYIGQQGRTKDGNDSPNVKSGAAAPAGSAAKGVEGPGLRIASWNEMRSRVDPTLNPMVQASGIGLASLAAVTWGTITGNEALVQAGLDGASGLKLSSGEGLSMAIGLGLGGRSGEVPRGVGKYEVGAFDALKSRSSPGDGLDIHHAIQKNPAGQVVEGYDPANGPSIAVPRGEHSRIPTLKGEYTGSVRGLLAKDIRDLRNSTNASNGSLRELVDLNKQMYPEAFGK
jgi:RHS repeat-associated protein